MSKSMRSRWQSQVVPGDVSLGSREPPMVSTSRIRAFCWGSLDAYGQAWSSLKVINLKDTVKQAIHFFPKSPDLSYYKIMRSKYKQCKWHQTRNWIEKDGVPCERSSSHFCPADYLQVIIIQDVVIWKERLKIRITNRIINFFSGGTRFYRDVRTEVEPWWCWGRPINQILQWE